MVARPISEGLPYFSLDTDMEQDDKIAFIEAKHGVLGFGIIVRLLMRIYRQGCYTMWTEREQFLFSKSINVDIMSTLTIVNDCINEGIFDQEMLETHGILTSHGIQVRYLKGCERRKKVVMIKEYCLLEPTDDVKTVNVTFISINADINPDKFNITQQQCDITLTETPQSKVKKSKVKESKELTKNAREGEPVDNSDGGTDVDLYPSGNGGEETPPPADNGSVESSPDFMAFWNEYPRRSGMGLATKAWREITGKGIPGADLVRAAKKYRVSVGGTAEQFIKMPHTFLVEGIFREYAPKIDPECPLCKGQGYIENEQRAMVECRCRHRLDIA